MNRTCLGVALFVTYCFSAVPVVAQTEPEGSDASAPPEATQRAEESDSAPEEPIRELFQNLFSDLRALPSRDTVNVLKFGVAFAGASRFLDHRIADAVGSEPALPAWDTISFLGTSYVHLGGALATYAIGRFTDKPAARHMGADLIRAQVLTGVLTLGLKAAVRRDRPHGGSFSFPSGHTSSTFATSTVLWRHFGWKIGAPASAVASLVGVARLEQNAHFLSDIVVGATLGIIGGRTITVGHRGTEVTVTPVAVPGGVAAMFIVVMP